MRVTSNTILYRLHRCFDFRKLRKQSSLKQNQNTEKVNFFKKKNIFYF